MNPLNRLLNFTDPRPTVNQEFGTGLSKTGHFLHWFALAKTVVKPKAASVFQPPQNPWRQAAFIAPFR